jgi:glycosyltransferase involved in cell wall biosynthesis
VTERGPIKVLLVASFPVQYATPQFIRYSRDPRLDVTVAYCSLRGVEPVQDPDFGVEVAWDLPLLEGHRWVHPPDRSGPLARRLVGFVNPGLWRLVREGGFDAVVCYGYRSTSHWIAAAAARRSGAKLVWTSDATRLRPRPDASGAWWKARLKRILLPLLLGSGDAILTPSTRGRRFLSSIGVGSARIFMTPFVVDNAFFAEGAQETDRLAVRKEWGVEPNAFVALFTGKLAPWKRPADLLGAAALVSNLVIVFAGDGVLRTELERRARTMGLEERVRFLGFVNQTELPATYASADVLVLPSEYEPFGVVVNEAFACGTPAIVTTACGAAEDLVRDMETGFTYAWGDVRALADSLGRLSTDSALRERLTTGAQARISRWGLQENADSFAWAMAEVVAMRS